eukprot:scaffold137175_cov30-Tisochrysis_lutea.AAC.4
MGARHAQRRVRHARLFVPISLGGFQLNGILRLLIVDRAHDREAPLLRVRALVLNVGANFEQILVKVGRTPWRVLVLHAGMRADVRGGASAYGEGTAGADSPGRLLLALPHPPLLGSTFGRPPA